VTRPLDADADLTVIGGGAGHAEGEVIHVMGRVLDARGAPVVGATVEIWQANAKGRYAHPADRNLAPLDPNFQGFGAQLTDGDGQYRFKTIKPAAYPINPMNPQRVRPPHIHFDVSGRDARLVTAWAPTGNVRSPRACRRRAPASSRTRCSCAGTSS
jgi:protocatechuate 3,4-dioxygenase, beta subunit